MIGMSRFGKQINLTKDVCKMLCSVLSSRMPISRAKVLLVVAVRLNPKILLLKPVSKKKIHVMNTA